MDQERADLNTRGAVERGNERPVIPNSLLKNGDDDDADDDDDDDDDVVDDDNDDSAVNDNYTHSASDSDIRLSKRAKLQRVKEGIIVSINLENFV